MSCSPAGKSLGFSRQATGGKTADHLQTAATLDVLVREIVQVMTAVLHYSTLCYQESAGGICTEFNCRKQIQKTVSDMEL